MDATRPQPRARTSNTTDLARMVFSRHSRSQWPAALPSATAGRGTGSIRLFHQGTLADAGFKLDKKGRTYRRDSRATACKLAHGIELRVSILLAMMSCIFRTLTPILRRSAILRRIDLSECGGYRL
jgi:hypothetical protein